MEFSYICKYFCERSAQRDALLAKNGLHPLLGDGYKAGGIWETIKTHPLVPKDILASRW
jgi:hypothetical protein